ncbi:hypothetical protein ALP60_200141 [Pseudomonas savastanoi]|uniref:Uncharacterized protein n=1 Tax=Pseudomonas savastanoi TaxID=29438 RepID=A0A3M5FNE1_PSESS|nr:hypothetical protein ALP60_200141 [Pseudomonas savastanoi]
MKWVEVSPVKLGWVPSKTTLSSVMEIGRFWPLSL